jgi:hypothetical protein
MENNDSTTQRQEPSVSTEPKTDNQTALIHRFVSWREKFDNEKLVLLFLFLLFIINASSARIYSLFILDADFRMRMTDAQVPFLFAITILFSVLISLRSLVCFFWLFRREQLSRAYGLAFYLVLLYSLGEAVGVYGDFLEKWSENGLFESPTVKYFLEDVCLKVSEIILVLVFIRQRSRELNKDNRHYSFLHAAHDLSFGFVGVRYWPKMRLRLPEEVTESL